MPLIQLLFALIIVGVALYVIELLPMDATIKRVIHIVVILIVLLWILQMLFGLFPMGSLHVR